MSSPLKEPRLRPEAVIAGTKPQRKERHVSDSFRRQRIDKLIILSMSQIIVVLRAHDLRDPLRLCELPWRDVTETNVADESFGLEIDQGLRSGYTINVSLRP